MGCTSINAINTRLFLQDLRGEKYFQYPYYKFVLTIIRTLAWRTAHWSIRQLHYIPTLNWFASCCLHYIAVMEIWLLLETHLPFPPQKAPCCSPSPDLTARNEGRLFKHWLWRYGRTHNDHKIYCLASPQRFVYSNKLVGLNRVFLKASQEQEVGIISLQRHPRQRWVVGWVLVAGWGASKVLNRNSAQVHPDHKTVELYCAGWAKLIAHSTGREAKKNGLLERCVDDVLVQTAGHMSGLLKCSVLYGASSWGRRGLTE